MPTHLYCLVPARSELTLPPSIRLLSLGDIGAWASTTDRPSLSRDAREIAKATIEHDRVIGVALRQGTTPVPVSLADPYADDASASQDIAAHAESIARALEQMRGLVEMTTIIALTDMAPGAETAGRGRAYLEQLRSQPARAAIIADRVATVFQSVSQRVRQRTENARVSLSHLVSRDSIDEYRARAVSQTGEGYRLVVDGPRAPYSFACFSPQRGIISDGAASAA